MAAEAVDEAMAITGAMCRNPNLVTATEVDLVVFDSASFPSALRLSESVAAQVDEARRTRTLDVA